MLISVVTPPPFEPVSLDEVYLHLRLDPIDGATPDDPMLIRQIRTAREQVEQMTRRSIIKQRLSLSLSAVPCGPIELKRPPYIGNVAATYYDINNQVQAITSPYVNTVSGLVPFIDLGYFGPTFCRPDAVTVQWDAGYPPREPASGVAATQEDYAFNVPGSIKDAILVGVQLLYDEIAVDKRAKLEQMQAALLSSYHVYSFQR